MNVDIWVSVSLRSLYDEHWTMKTDKYTNLKKYSNVKQAMQTASICSRSGLFCGSLSSSRTFRVGRWLRQLQTSSRRMKQCLLPEKILGVQSGPRYISEIFRKRNKMLVVKKYKQKPSKTAVIKYLRSILLHVDAFSFHFL